MNPFKAIGLFFKKVGAVIGAAVIAAMGHGLTDEIIHLALQRVKQVAEMQLDNAERREHVVTFLVKIAHVPESIARLAVEMAVQLAKKELGQIPA